MEQLIKDYLLDEWEVDGRVVKTKNRHYKSGDFTLTGSKKKRAVKARVNLFVHDSPEFAEGIVLQHNLFIKRNDIKAQSKIIRDELHKESLLLLAALGLE